MSTRLITMDRELMALARPTSPLIKPVYAGDDDAMGLKASITSAWRYSRPMGSRNS